MVVEDEPDIYDVLLAMFGIWGIEGVAFVDGEEAVAWIDDVDNKRFVGELPELAILDIRLTGDIEGHQVGERLRNSPVLRDIAIVLITAYKLAPDAEAAIRQQAGADALIYKPLPKFTELKQSLEAVLAKRRAERVDESPSPPAADDKSPAADDKSPAADDKSPAIEPAAPPKPKPTRRRVLKRRLVRGKASSKDSAGKAGGKSAGKTASERDKNGTAKPDKD